MKDKWCLYLDSESDQNQWMVKQITNILKTVSSFIQSNVIIVELFGFATIYKYNAQI